mgnify:CR=1 FL=1
MGLAAALPRDWTILQVYFAITVIISLLGWTELARVIRGRFLALREEDFVVSARLVGCSQMRTIFVHMVPSFMSHIIAATTLALPAMIISETALSFLGLGLRPPAISWGVLLQQAQNVQTVAISPWLMLPAVPVIVVVMAFNFLGDGLAGRGGSLWTLSRLLSVRNLKTYFAQDEGHGEGGGRRQPRDESRGRRSGSSARAGAARASRRARSCESSTAPAGSSRARSGSGAPPRTAGRESRRRPREARAQQRRRCGRSAAPRSR